MTVTNTVTLQICLLLLTMLGIMKADRCVDRNIPGVTTKKVRSLGEIERNNKRSDSGWEGKRKVKDIGKDQTG